MKRLILFNLMAIIMLAGCRVTDLPELENELPKGQPAILTVSCFVPSMVTKATGDDVAIKSLDLFVFNEEGDVESHTRLEDGVTVATLYVVTGEKRICVFANYDTDRMAAIRGRADADAFVPRFADNHRGAIAMRGSVDVEVSRATYSLSVPVRRDVAKVVIESEPTFSGKSAGGVLKGIFLNNIPKVYDEEVVLKEGDAAKAWNFGSTLAEEPVKDLTSTEGGDSWKEPLYGYPNASPEADDESGTDYVSKLILLAEVNGKNYYYPVGIPGMEANKLYKFTHLNLSRLGTDDPNRYIEITFDVDLEIVDMDEGESESSFNPAGFVFYADKNEVIKTYKGGMEYVRLTAYTEKADGSKEDYFPKTSESIESFIDVYVSKDNGKTWLKPSFSSEAQHRIAYIDGEFRIQFDADELNNRISSYELSILSKSPKEKLLGSEWPDDKLTPRGSDGAPVDLSMEDCKGNRLDARCSSNTYIIRAPGVYMIPAIYGNAVVNGEVNAEAYNMPIIGLDCVNAYGNAISSAYINEDLAQTGNYLNQAQLVWEDTPGSVVVSRALQARDGVAYLAFTVPKEKIARGNALVCVKDNEGNIVWSWHLWITPDDVTDDHEYNVVGTGSFVTCMKNHLGYMPQFTRTNIAEGFEYIVKFVQKKEPYGELNVRVKRLKYREDLETIPASKLLYQKGRKEPFRVDTPDDMKVENTSLPYKWTILHPDMLIKDDAWGSFYYWGGRYSNSPTKMIYDPTPYGYVILRSNVEPNSEHWGVSVGMDWARLWSGVLAQKTN